MVCGCVQCGTLMVHAEKGSESQCVCPACGSNCDACLGRGKPMQRGGDVPLDILLRYGQGDGEEQQ